VNGEVTILGCGPAGLLAAYAVERLGGSAVIVSRKIKSALPGAQYLHEPIPGLSGEPDGVIRTYRQGTREGYAKKVYGDPAAPCSWDDQAEEREAWDLRALYDRLWGMYQSQVVDAEISWSALDRVGQRSRLVISTLPLIKSCHQQAHRSGDHRFDWESMWTIDYASPDVADNTVLYSGSEEQSWYRASRVFGHASTEWSNLNPPLGGAYLTPEEEKPPLIFVPRKGIKVKGATCDCWPLIKRAGRFGTWTKNYLTHHAFRDATIFYQEAFG
jgi:hypothetical protein